MASLSSHVVSPLFDLLGRSIGQVGIVVPDLEQAARAHPGFGPWSVYTYDREFVPNLQAGGAPGEFAMRIALNASQPQIELIQPLDERSPYARWMARAGPGLHHLGYVVDDIAATTEAMRAAGYEVILSGSGYGIDGDGGFCYFDTVDEVGYVTEAIERPARRRDPEAVWP